MAEFFHVFAPQQPGSALVDGQQLGLQTAYGWAPAPALALTREWFPQGMTAHGVRYLLGADPQLERDRAIEITWELVRRLEFPDRPSRLTSIFAWDSLEDAQAFQARQRAFTATAVYRVEGESLLRANMPLLTALAGAGGSALQDARDYWAGKRGAAPELWEHLLRPPVTVVRQVA